MSLNKLNVLLVIIAWGGCTVGYADEATIARGNAVYQQVCFNCHGPTLDGGIGPSLRDNYWRHGSAPEAILKVINKGVPNTEMIGYEAVFPDSDRRALRDFILSEQEGMRETLRSSYVRDYFQGKRLTSALFRGVESDEQARLPENVFYAPRNYDMVYRGTAKLYVKKLGDYRFKTRPPGRTTILLNGEEVLFFDEKTDASTHVEKQITLNKGVYDLEVLHEEPKRHGIRFHLGLEKIGDKLLTLTGRGLEGNVPKVIRARAEARVVRKWIDGLPPRTLLCILPNQVIVAYDPTCSRVLKAWHSALVNQTPSLDNRSQRPSELRGTLIVDLPGSLPDCEQVQFHYYEVSGDDVLIATELNGEMKTVRIAPDGGQSFAVTLD